MGYSRWATWWLVGAVSISSMVAAQGVPAGSTFGGGGEPALLQRVDAWLGGLSRPSLEGIESSPAQGQRVYRYRRDGRAAFTNIAEHVPPVQRAGAELDLSHVRLNSELGQRIDARLQRAHATLTKGPMCQQARGREDRLDALLGLCQRHRTPCLFAGVLALLLLISPAMIRRVDPLAWRRVMFFAIPALTAAGLFSYSVERSGLAVERLLSGSPSERCDPDGYRALAAEEAPLTVRLSLLQALQTQQQALSAVASEGRAGERGLEK